MGMRLAEFCRSRGQSQLSPAALQAAIADLAADEVKLLIPLRDLATRSDLCSMVALAGTGQARALRDGLLQDLRGTYSPSLVVALAEVLNGLLDLSSEEIPVAFPPESSPSLPVSRSVPKRSARPGLIIAVGFLAPLLLVAAGFGLKQSPLCSVVGLCADKPVDSGAVAIEQAFAAASSAEEALRRATSLGDYRNALEQLDLQVLQLRKLPLSPEQRRQWTALDEAVLQGRRTLAAETADAERLELAAAAIARLVSLSGRSRDQEVNLVRQYLDSIPANSFAAAEVAGLRLRLDQILSTTTAEPAEPEISQPPPAPAPAPVSPIPSSPPAPRDEVPNSP